MRRQLTILPLILLLLLSVSPAAAQDSGTVQAEIVVTPGEYTVGDPIELTLAVTHPVDYHVILPQIEEIWGDFTVYEKSIPETESNGDGTETTKQLIDARLFTPGTSSTPPLLVKVTDPNGQLVQVTASPATVQVSSVLVEGDTNLRDIKAQAELPFSTIWPWVLGIVTLAVVASALASRLWLKKRRERLTVDSRLPHEVALDELAHIEQLGLAKEGRFREHYTLISDCIRLYVENRYSIPVLERTTSEVKSALRKGSVNQSFSVRFLRLLNEADMVKFAKYKPQVSDAQLVLANAREIVELTKPHPATETNENNSLQMTDPAKSLLGRSLSQNGSQKHSEVNV